MEPTPQGLLVGVIAAAIGPWPVLRGFRLFMLPLLGFVGGFLLGAGLVEAVAGNGFLATLLGWAVGPALGLVLAELCHLYHWLAVGVLGGFMGYRLTLGLLARIGLAETGALSMLIAFVVVLGLGLAFLLLRMPTVLAIVGTAIAGAGLAVAGLTLALGLAPSARLRDGILGIYRGEDLGWLGVVVLLVLSLVGMVSQVRMLSPDDTVIDASAFRNPGIGGASGPGGPAAAQDGRGWPWA